VEQEPEVSIVSAGRAAPLCNMDETPTIVAIAEVGQLPYKLPEVDAVWIQKYGPVETTTLYFAVMPNYAAECYNREHSLEEIHPCERNGMALSPNGSERTASTSYHNGRFYDHSQHGRRADGTRESGDSLELASKVQETPKPELFRMSTGQIVAKARAHLEAAARSDQSLPDWLEYPICIITPAGRRYYERLLKEAQGDEASVTILQSVPAAVAQQEHAQAEPREPQPLVRGMYVSTPVGLATVETVSYLEGEQRWRCSVWTDDSHYAQLYVSEVQIVQQGRFL
jgi:hypothetical protein